MRHYLENFKPQERTVIPLGWQEEEIKKRSKVKEENYHYAEGIQALWERLRYENGIIDRRLRLGYGYDELRGYDWWKFTYYPNQRITMSFGFKTFDDDTIKLYYCAKTGRNYAYYAELIPSKNRIGYFDEIEHYYYMEKEDIRNILKACICAEDPIAKGILREIPRSEHQWFFHG